jgi:hypothetical protein
MILLPMKNMASRLLAGQSLRMNEIYLLAFWFCDLR